MLSIGEKAPNFELLDQKGVIHQLSDYKGKKLVIYFYPKDNTPGCTAQACNIRDHYSQLLEKNIAILGVSLDSQKSHLKFEEKYSLPFPLLIDEAKIMVNDYEVWQLKKFMGKENMGIVRTTFLINESGNIEHIITKVDTKNHSEQILKTWNLISE